MCKAYFYRNRQEKRRACTGREGWLCLIKINVSRDPLQLSPTKLSVEFSRWQWFALRSLSHLNYVHLVFIIFIINRISTHSHGCLRISSLPFTDAVVLAIRWWPSACTVIVCSWLQSDQDENLHLQIWSRGFHPEIVWMLTPSCYFKYVSVLSEAEDRLVSTLWQS